MSLDFKLCAPCMRYNSKANVAIRKEYLTTLRLNPDQMDVEGMDDLIATMLRNHNRISDLCQECMLECQGRRACATSKKNKVIIAKLQLNNAEETLKLVMLRCRKFSESKSCDKTKKKLARQILLFRDRLKAVQK